MIEILANEEYARMLNGRIIEYPVPHGSILQEELASGTVKQVGYSEDDATLEVDKFHKFVTTVIVVGGAPVRRCSVVYKTAEEFIQEHYIKPLEPYFHLPALVVSALPHHVHTDMVNAIRDLGSMQLDRFAQEKGYDNILSLVTYRDDVYTRFRKEAERGIAVRSHYWSIFTEFNESVLGGAEFPRTVEGISKMFPNLNWD